MARTLLAEHRQIETADVDQARREVGERFCAHRLELTRRDGRLDMVHSSASIGADISLNYLRYGDEVRITPGTFDDFFLVQVPLQGTARVRVGEQVVASSRSRASVGSPTEAVDMVWSDGCEQLLVYLRRHAVEELASDGEATAPVVFNPAMDLETPATRAWLRLVHLALDDIEAGGALFRSPLASTHFEQTLIAGLLAAQPNNRQVVAPPETSCPRVVRAVVDLIEAEPERAWRLAELARHAGVSARTLQEAFQRELGMTPLERLRSARIARARADLLAADPATVSVTDIAAQWGFFHLGRFAQAYRAAYQELPSQTLKR
ncbi:MULTISPECIES: AraC family transcriptional regulator [unclassified Nocardioides]|uniref:AraC family transcriptional regulator n=1 Tax=unclassified Nocardioides TaxID=2615069 RepID=UPI001153DB41|nr:MULTISPECIES: AraC family transcriptional regulator [unclassified Nocardioides]TQK69906.1 helix-turn-helix protein [Nocardioides sp. SLBN-35]WGY00858.1 AraC family transcriptional regulator [Nocardioides sp. QY071]